MVFWDLSAGLILLVPSVFPMLVVFGMMGWMGVVIDVGTIMTPTVALGVSVDDVVHFLIWYRRGLSEGKTRKQAVMLAYEGCARAMYQSWAVLGLGLAVFALSSFVPTQRFGADVHAAHGGPDWQSGAAAGRADQSDFVLLRPATGATSPGKWPRQRRDRRDEVAAATAQQSGPQPTAAQPTVKCAATRRTACGPDAVVRYGRLVGPHKTIATDWPIDV